ncbi:MAG TPA: hypothetical protein VGL79_00475, partial [Solirubrobacteraceae bacterium]
MSQVPRRSARLSPLSQTRPPRHARQAALPWLWAILVMALVVLLDQLSKAAVRKSIVPGETRSVLP